MTYSPQWDSAKSYFTTIPFEHNRLISFQTVNFSLSWEWYRMFAIPPGWNQAPLPWKSPILSVETPALQWRPRLDSKSQMLCNKASLKHIHCYLIVKQHLYVWGLLLIICVEWNLRFLSSSSLVLISSLLPMCTWFTDVSFGMVFMLMLHLLLVLWGWGIHRTCDPFPFMCNIEWLLAQRVSWFD